MISIRVPAAARSMGVLVVGNDEERRTTLEDGAGVGVPDRNLPFQSIIPIFRRPITPSISITDNGNLFAWPSSIR